MTPDQTDDFTLMCEMWEYIRRIIENEDIYDSTKVAMIFDVFEAWDRG